MSSVKFASDGPAAPKATAAGGGGGGGGLGMICATCKVKFSTMDELRKHYGCEWHTANVRLRVDGRKPMTMHVFRVQQNMAGDEQSDRLEFTCKICKKHFKSVHTLQAHVKSTEHLLQKEKVILARDSEAGSMLTSTSLGSAAIGLHRRAKAHKAHTKKHVDPFKPKKCDSKLTPEDREADVDEKRCFYCGLPSEDIDANLAHMQEFHTFSLPMEHRLEDKVGMMQYLSRKINGLVCLVCNDETRQVPSLAALRDHMTAKNHEYINLNNEYSEFYKGGVDSGEAVEKDDNEPSDKLVVSSSGAKRVLKKRDEAAPIHRHLEADNQLEQRRLITSQQVAADAVIKKERMDIMRKDVKAQHKIQNAGNRRDKQFMLKTGVRNNILHPKGYDGEGKGA